MVQSTEIILHIMSIWRYGTCGCQAIVSQCILIMKSKLFCLLNLLIDRAINLPLYFNLQIDTNDDQEPL